MKTVFDETRIAGLKLKNRVFRSATYEGFADANGHLTEKLRQIYEDLAKGEVGTIITGLAYVTDVEQPYPGQMGISDDSFIAEYRELTQAVHAYGANIILQLVALGSQTSKSSEKVMWGPSAVEDLFYKTTPAEMTREDIHSVQAAFAAAAARARQAGFDGVQIHGAHGYLLSKFLTPYYNRRQDEYGGSIENRARMTVETYQAIREKTGPDFPVFIKINCDDFMEQGMTFSECKSVCKKLAKLGIQAIEVSGGSGSSRAGEGVIRRIASGEQQSYFKTYADEIAREVNVPVISVGGHRNIDILTDMLNQTAIEYISFSRPFICESNLIQRWQNGDTKPAKCTSCTKCFRLGGTTCIFNRTKSEK